MKKIASSTLKAAINNFVYRENSYEIFGFDFMIDSTFNTWLIEVNKSPALEYSTPTTERLSKQIQRDLAALVEEYYLVEPRQRVNT